MDAGEALYSVVEKGYFVTELDDFESHACETNIFQPGFDFVVSQAASLSHGNRRQRIIYIVFTQKRRFDVQLAERRTDSEKLNLQTPMKRHHKLGYRHGAAGQTLQPPRRFVLPWPQREDHRR